MAWPGQRIEIPKVPLVKVARGGFSTSGTLYPGDPDPEVFAYGGDMPMIDIPPELVIRELPPLDASDPDALVEFMNRHGAMTPFTGDGRDHRSLLPRPYWQFAPAEADVFVSAPLDLVRLHVRTLQALVAHWEAATLYDADDRILDIWSRSGWPWTPNDVPAAWGMWSDFLNAALSPFTVRVEVLHGADDRRLGFQHRAISTYSAMALQLANDVATQTPWRRCSNETCGQLFVRQAGRAEHGQHRSTGVKYCTKECAGAQAQREWRRRQAREKESPSDG